MGTEMRELLHSMDAGEQAELPRAKLLALRRATFTEAVKEMVAPDELAKWVSMMKVSYPGGVAVWDNKLTWLEALAVVRYGEDTRHWPAKFSANDVQRAEKWMQGKRPDGVSYPGTVSETLLSVGLLLLACGGMALALLNSAPENLLFLLPLFGTAMSDYLENKRVDDMFRTTTYSRAAVLAVALYTAAPGETGGGTEVTGGSYARVDLPPLNTNWNATQGGTSGVSSGTGGLTDNAVVITFPAPTGNWGLCTHFAILDATSGGNFLIYGALTQAKTVNSGDPAPTFPTGTLDVTFA